MTIILQEGDELTHVVLQDGSIIPRESMREYRLSDGRIALDCGKCNERAVTSRFVVDKDGIISEWRA